ncbi:MAG: hybrid sensor histidine kinase/response regulator, partial [Burkholderiaceae bacterium]|nr:hybrid sensor histidine kinase/response regulator [Burkholderiaceae bacterium]
MVAQHFRNASETGVEDLGPLAWVLDETRKSIEAATKALKRYVREAQAARGVNLESVDANPLRVARQQLHQVQGVLDMVGQTIAARMVGGMEEAMQRFTAKPQEASSSAVAVQETAGFALIEYLESQLSAHPRPALGLFAQYRQVQELAGADRIHPADLWDWPWTWAAPRPLQTVQKRDYSAETRRRLDRDILNIMRHEDASAAVDLGAASLELAANENQNRHAHPAAFWMLAAGFFQALGARRVPLDIYAKRAISRVLLQYITLAQGDGVVSERLAQDLLFFCAQAGSSGIAALSALAAVRAAWGLERYVPVDYSQPVFGLFDPAVLTQARRRVDAIKENWSALAGGDLSRVQACSEQLGLVTESLSKLLPKARPLADELKTVMAQVARANHPPSPELAMETATAVLFLEASFADFHPADSLLQARMQQLAQRLKTVREGAPGPTLEPWMEQLYREVSDRQTMGTVVGELRATMGEVEGRLDQFFRQSADKTPLAQVPDLMNQMRGVLSVLGLDQAVHAVARMREQVQHLIDGSMPPGETSNVFNRLANNLGSLGFLVDMLGYQPALARKLFVFDAQSGELKAPMMRARAPGSFTDRPATIDVDTVDFRTEKPGAPVTTPVPLDFDLSEPGGLPAYGAAASAAVALPPIEEQSPSTGGFVTTAPQALTAATPALQDKLDRITAQAALAEKPALAAAARQATAAVSQQDAAGLSAALQTVNQLRGATMPASLSATSVAAADAAGGQAAQDADDDLLSIFLDEAREVIATGQAAIQALAATPGDVEQKTTLRRTFHTLKGSSR